MKNVLKHLKKFNESSDIEEDILENFIYITDMLGKPNIRKEKWGNLDKWIIMWNLGLNIDQLNEASFIVERLKSIINELDDILAAKDRMKDFDFMVGLSNKLIISITPKQTGENEYKFIKFYEWREINLDLSEIERFYDSRGIKVVKSSISDDELSETSEVKIILDRGDVDVNAEFESLLIIELEEIDRDVAINTSDEIIEIYPEGEKTYITINQYP